MRYAVLKGAAYVLVHAPGMLLHSGTTQTTERAVNPQSEYLKNLPDSIRSYEAVLAYPPNQVFIGNMTPDELGAIPFPWHDKTAASFSPEGRFGEILPEDLFIGLMQVCDAFGLVKLSKSFVEVVKEKFHQHPLLSGYGERLSGEEPENIAPLIENADAEPLTVDGVIIGCVRRAHDIDVNLSAHVMLENLASKASAVLAFLNLLDKNKVNAKDIDYVIECSEEACGDMNQRGGGNFAKSIAEIAGAVNATGSDTRGFCAAPVHALIEAASLVKAGTFSQVAVVAGGATAKLGMNGKDHVKKGIPLLEDVLGGFATLVGPDDGVNPLLNTDLVGRHTVGTGSAPQAVISSLVSAPLDKAGLRITDVDKFATEMQNPDITKPAGAGDVPEANYKMIAALSVMRKETERAGINAFIARHGIPGYAPTQGHIPSGAPYLGFAREALTRGNMNRIMIVGKGSLFLGRMTNLFDGISILLERNPGKPEIETPSSLKEAVPVKRLCIGLTGFGSEHGEGALAEGAQLAKIQDGGFDIRMVGNHESDMHSQMEALLDGGQLDACVTLHYNFPIGVSTIGRVTAPATGKEILIASTTGASAADRVEAMIRNALYGVATAKALGMASPSVGIVNVDGARTVENALKTLQKNGYAIRFAGSSRADGGVLMRGNDLLRGAADVMVTDTLTGNILMKMFSSFTTGGGYESVGYGYGPGLGEDFIKRLVLIISRASGAPVVANALKYAAQIAQNGVMVYLRNEIASAKRAGLTEILNALPKNTGVKTDAVSMPDKEPVTEEITGIDIMQLDDAAKILWQAGIYAESGMGCAGPVILVGADKRTAASKILKEAALIPADA